MHSRLNYFDYLFDSFSRYQLWAHHHLYQKTEAITLITDAICLNFLRGGNPGCFYCLLWFFFFIYEQSGQPTSHLGRKSPDEFGLIKLKTSKKKPQNFQSLDLESIFETAILQTIYSSLRWQSKQSELSRHWYQWFLLWVEHSHIYYWWSCREWPPLDRLWSLLFVILREYYLRCYPCSNRGSFPFEADNWSHFDFLCIFVTLTRTDFYRTSSAKKRRKIFAFFEGFCDKLCRILISQIRKHLGGTRFSLSLSIYLSIYLSICMYVCVSGVCMGVNVCVCDLVCDCACVWDFS